MRFKRLLALLLAAALALSLLAGCGGGKNQSLSQMLLNLLDGQYQNVSVEIDSDLEAKLRQAISESETDEELRAALEQLLGGGISFQRLGSGQQGDSAWTLIIYPGTDPDAAARSVYLDLDKVFAALPADGVYSSGFAMAEMENGYAILVKATVDKAGTEDKPDPVTLKSIAVTTNPKLEYWVGEPFDPANMVITATYSNNTTKTLKDIEKNGDQGVKWTPDGALTTEGTHDITISYGGKTTTVTVKVEEPTVDTLDVGVFSLAYYAGATFDPEALGMITATYTNGKTENVLPTDCTFSIDGQGITLPYRFETVGDYTLTVTYKGGTDTVDITVNFGTVTSITVSGPTKTEYEVGQTFSSAGLMVTAHDDYGNSESVSDYTFTITDENNKEVDSPYKFDTAGTYTLTVSYNNMEATVEITVNPATVTDIEVTQNPTKMTYISGESFDPAGMTITATYSDGTKTAVTDYTCSPETVTKDNTKVTITYGELETTVTVQILEGKNSYNAETKTYSIATADGLLAWNKAVQSNLSLNCILTEKIDLKDKAWTPIGSGFSSNTGYQGTFNGGGHTITGLSITTNSTDGGNAVLFDGIGSNGTVKNLQLVDVNYNVQQGVASGIVNVNYGTITACSVTGDIAARTSDIGGIASINNGSIIGCWFDGNLKTNYVEGGIAAYNYGTITACFYGGNAGQGVYSNQGETAETTKVGNSTVTWATAVNGMNAALTGNDYQWVLGTDDLPVLQKKQ